MNDPQKEAREIAARHGIKAYEPPTETGKAEPGCECRPRKHLSWMLGTYEGKHKAMCQTLATSTIYANEPPPPSYHPTTAPFPVLGCNCGLFYLQRLIADPCSCEQLRIKAEMLERVLTANATRHLAKCEQLREQNEGLRAAVRNQARTICELQSECEQLREDRAKIELRCNWADAGKRVAEADAKSYSGIITNIISVLTQEFFRLSPSGDLPSAGSLGLQGIALRAVFGEAVWNLSDEETAEFCKSLVSELHAARSLLEEARLALVSLSTWNSSARDMKAQAASALAKIEAAQKGGKV